MVQYVFYSEAFINNQLRLYCKQVKLSLINTQIQMLVIMRSTLQDDKVSQ